MHGQSFGIEMLSMGISHTSVTTRNTIRMAGEPSHIVTDTGHCTEAAARMGQAPVQIPEGEALALRSTRIMGRLRAPINPQYVMGIRTRKGQ